MSRGGKELTTFNSLSRDHKFRDWPDGVADVADFQLPLSGSRRYPKLISPVPSSFNSLSRDHQQPNHITTAPLEAFQLPLSGSLLRLVEEVMEREKMNLSTPSLGITSSITRVGLNSSIILSTPSLGITRENHKVLVVSE